MTLIILALYGVIIITYTLISLFVAYHLIKYSINAKLNLILLPVFIAISAGLLLSNLMLFFSINWNEVWENLFL